MCGSKELVTDSGSGEVVCSKCGLVIEDLMLEQKPEWRAFTRVLQILLNCSSISALFSSSIIDDSFFPKSFKDDPML